MDKVVAIVALSDLQISCVIGVYQEERLMPQDIFIDIELQSDCSTAVQNDTVEGTIDYESVAKALEELAQAREFYLLETFAFEALKLLFRRNQNIVWGIIKVKKPAALAFAKYASAEIEQGKRQSWSGR